VVEARLNFTNRRLASAARRRQIAAIDLITALERIGYRGAVRSGRTGARPRRRVRAFPHQCSGRGLAADEHHAALGVGLAGAIDMPAGDARFLPCASG